MERHWGVDSIMEAKELAAMVDSYEEAREARLEKDREAKQLLSVENAAKAKIIEELRRQEVDVVGGKHLTVTLVKKQKPQAAEWAALYEFIWEHKAFDLLHRRLTEKAVKDRWEEGEVIPGVIEVDVYDLSRSTVRTK